MIMSTREKKYMKKSELDKFVNKYSNLDCKDFGYALEILLEENHMSKTDLSKIIGVDNQCLTNWTSPSTDKPKWLNVMYRMNLFFHDYDKNFDSLCLYDKSYRSQILSQKIKLEAKEEELEKQKHIYEQELQNIDYKKSLITMIDKLESDFTINIGQLLDDLYSLLLYKKVSCGEQKDKAIENYNKVKYNCSVDNFVFKYIYKF